VVGEGSRAAARCRGIGHREGEIGWGYGAIPASGQQASGSVQCAGIQRASEQRWIIE
jgi:hypothetical protein